MMKKLILFLMMMAVCSQAFAITKTPINEYSTAVVTSPGHGYTEIGGGINYQKDDGSFAESNPAIVASVRTGINWECYTTYNRVGFMTDITTGAYSVFSQIGNSGKILKSKPVGIAYLNIDTKAYQIFAPLQSSVGVVSGNTIRYNDAFLNCDLEYVILKDRFKQNLHIKSNAGFPASPYPAAETYVVVVTEFDLANFELPTLVDERGTTAFNDSGDDTDGELKFSDQRFEMSLATDNAGATQAIKKRLVKVAGVYYYLEGLPYSYLVGASYPVLLDYTTVSSNVASGTTWSSGTYYISTSIACGTVYQGASSFTIGGGVVVKFASAASMGVSGLTISSTDENPVIFTSMNDNTVGESITGSSGSPAAGDWAGINNQYYGTAAASISGFVIRYATTAIYPGGYYNVGWTISNGVIINCSVMGLQYSYEASPVTNVQFINCTVGAAGTNLNTKYYTNCLFKNNTTYGYGGSYVQGVLNNCTFDGNNIALQVAQPDTLSVNNCIISNNTQNLVLNQGGAGGTINLNYCLQYNNVTTNNASSNNNPITPANPNFATGTAATGYLGDMTYFLNQSTSPCKDAGSDTAANLGMDTYTTATDKTTDSGTVDIGYHYTVADVSYSGGGASTNSGFFLLGVD